MLPEIRRAQAKDSEGLLDLWRKLGRDQFVKDPYYQGDLDICFNYDFKGIIQRPECCIFVAEADRRIVGFIEVWIRKKDQGFYIDDHIYMMHSFVEPAHRGQGTLHRFIEKIREWAAENRIHYLVADVLRTNGLVIDLLTKMGFSEYRVKMVQALDGQKRDVL